MKQQLFEQQNRQTWQQLQDLLQTLESTKKQKPDQKNLLAFSSLYRSTCYDLALAKTRQYSPQLIERLHALVMRAHQQLYRSKQIILWRILSFIIIGFPAMVRHRSRLIWISTALFYLPAILVGWLCYSNSEMIFSIVPESQVVEFETMYRPDNKVLGRNRESATDIMMFGHYIQNNIGIGFRTFAGGLLLGVGSVLSLLFNGVVIGGVSGHLTQLGYIETFWSFVAGHSAFELTAICISGAAGLVLALALFAPGRLRRLDALQLAAQDALVLVMGAALMLVIAAFIEAFWSSSTVISPTVKYAVAVVMWSAVITYFLFAGRRHAG